VELLDLWPVVGVQWQVPIMQDLNPCPKKMMVRRTMRTRMMKIWMIVMKWVRKRRKMTIVMMVK